MHKLSDKRVAIIGTGATAVQCVPRLAVACQALYVFQRTPSSVDERNNQPIDPAWFSSIATPGWQQRWLDNFTANQTGAAADVDLVMDGWTEITRRIRARVALLPPDERTAMRRLQAFEDADFEKMEQIRARVDRVVEDRETAQKLKAWYRQLCKRPCFHDEYLQAYNLPSTRLIDTDGKGVERITERGVVASGKEYEVDCIIYASGFAVGYAVGPSDLGKAVAQQLGFDIAGREGVLLSKYWAKGMRTKHGIHIHGFPNLFLVQPTQAANLISNVPHNLVESGKTIAHVVKRVLERGLRTVEVTRQAEDAWIETLLSGPGSMLGSRDCTPGYYNNEGQEPGPAALLNVGYPLGASAYFQYLEAWRKGDELEGLELG
jgi:cyclohexanone monooxygenase